MSCQCGVCYQTVAQPDSLWYAAAATKMTTCYVCGSCLSLIPAEVRIPTDRQRDFDVTFGPMRADTDDHGTYQTSGSSLMPPRFWVPAEALESVFRPECELMADFYPIRRMERFLREMVHAERAGIWPPWPCERRSRDQILMEFGGAIRTYLNLPPAPHVEDRPIISVTRSPVEVPPGQARLAAELWTEVVKWCGKGSQGPLQALGRRWRSFRE